MGIAARMRYGCIILNSFPRSLQITWENGASDAARRHYARWCAGPWRTEGRREILPWTVAELRHYYLYHLFLHEIGHVHQPCFHATRRREAFAENFALEWAERLGELPPAPSRGASAGP